MTRPADRKVEPGLSVGDEPIRGRSPAGTRLPEHASARGPVMIGASSNIKIVNVAVERDAGHDEALDLVGSLVDLGDLSPGRGRSGDLSRSSG
jgi:hypothetical protein